MSEPRLRPDVATLFDAGPVSPDSASAVRANARAVLGLVAGEADAIESAGRLTDPVLRAFRAAGLFEMGFPRSRGGLEMRLVDQVSVVAEVARVDASAGWNIAVLNAGGYYAGRLGADAYRELFPTRDLPTAGAFHPPGRAEQVPGGYLVSGNWDWGSGSYHAERIVGGCQVFDGGVPVLEDNGKQRLLGIWLPAGSVRLADNWRTIGLCGSGSTSYAVAEPAFVPAHHAFDREARPNPDADPLNKDVKIAHFPLTGVCLGLAQHAVDIALEAVRRRGDSPPDSATSQALGGALTEIDFCYAGILDIARRTDEVIFRPGETLDRVQTARMTAANTVAGNVLRRVLPICLDLVGARHVFETHPMQRVVRDATTALAHAGTRATHAGALATAVVDDPRAAATTPEADAFAAKSRS
ncbi:MAG TPA: acyl-CoA dehydrogenase family protein [Pseudonocardia sp.]|uniref:acyl-CoA dehydrogenase family protein n=1 Tax=Pseudonocardia sp. TaxID=60912 RepID=UPI002EDBA9F4